MEADQPLQLSLKLRFLPVALLQWRTMCGDTPAVWEYLEPSRHSPGGFMPRDAEGYALMDSRYLDGRKRRKKGNRGN